ncbi:hypothetical protein EVAR_90061_1 [Eumeta japonica]|uniref:Uncharacterized protein n=1 Tax=Eumeta variegata TaxID=151549 RepID=A0A4C1WTF6_EUMVA|nr:hypothetical protein EVAR_90061_1 [Eumeta japonica]
MTTNTNVHYNQLDLCKLNSNLEKRTNIERYHSGTAGDIHLVSPASAVAAAANVMENACFHAGYDTRQTPRPPGEVSNGRRARPRWKRTVLNIMKIGYRNATCSYFQIDNKDCHTLCMLSIEFDCWMKLVNMSGVGSMVNSVTFLLEASIAKKDQDWYRDRYWRNRIGSDYVLELTSITGPWSGVEVTAKIANNKNEGIHCMCIGAKPGAHFNYKEDCVNYNLRSAKRTGDR